VKELQEKVSQETPGAVQIFEVNIKSEFLFKGIKTDILLMKSHVCAVVVLHDIFKTD